MKIIRNAIRCKKCGEVIESKSVHDFKFCSCGACVPLTEDTNISADAVSSRTGKSWRRPKKLMTTDFA